MAQLVRTLTGTSQRSQRSQLSKTDPTSLAAPVPISRMTTTNTQTGMLNHLTESQEKQLDEFKEKLQQDGWWSPDGVNGKPTHDDGTLLRYLRARKFDVQGAYGQFTDTEKWLKEQFVEDLYEHFDVDFFERARLLYPQWTGHRDRRGIPLYVFEIKGLDSKHVDKYQKESTAYKATLPKHKDLSTPPKLLPLFALYHNLLNFILPFVSTLERPNPEVPVTNSTNIVDISGVSLRQFWNLKTHMQDASVLATAHYPETLDRIFIIGAPSFFPTVWGWVKRWFDPVTVSKIFILGRHEVKPTLEKFMDPDSIPQKYGGNLDWRWGDIPHLDQETREALERDGNSGWVKGPALWLNNERVVVGSENGKLRRSDKEIAEKKPIVYAADYTEEPVHPEKRASLVSNHRTSPSLKAAAGVPKNEAVKEEDLRSESPSTLVEGKQTRATSSATAVAAESLPDLPVPVQSQLPAHISLENVRTSPMGDSQVHVPKAQPAHPAKTAEYISTNTATKEVQKEAQSEETEGSITTKATVVPVAAPTTIPTVTVSDDKVPPPPGLTQPGPLPAHTAELNRAIATKLEQESTIVIPASSSGPLPHPDIIAASDAAKGLAIEADKLALGSSALTQRPLAERFVTALEVQH